MSKELLKEEIKLHEGFRDTIYRDSLGFKTIGYGHKIVHTDKFMQDKACPKDILEDLFDKDFEKVWDLMTRFCSVNNLNVSEKAQEVLCEMIYQMGYSGVGKFKNMIKALQNNDTKTASIEMLDSRWAKQTPNRAKALSDKMSNA